MLKISHIPEPKRNKKGKLICELDNLKHVKKVYDIDEKDRVCEECGL